MTPLYLLPTPTGAILVVLALGELELELLVYDGGGVTSSFAVWRSSGRTWGMVVAGLA